MKRRIINILAAAAAVLSAAACTGTKETEAISMSISIEPAEMLVKAEGESAVITFNAPDYWFINSPVDWVTFEPASGKPGENTVTVTPAHNTGNAERSAVITVISKTNKGQFTIKQNAWPYSSNTWALSGTANNGSSVAMTDQGEALVWKAEKVSFHQGEAFKLYMGSTITLGLDKAFEKVKDVDNTYKTILKKGGSDITLPGDGFWDITLDVSDWSVTAVLVERFPWTIIGTIDGSDWDKDFSMTDKGDQLVWEAKNVPYEEGDVFKFRMDARNDVVMGIDGEFAADEDAEDTYVAKIKKDGGNFTLPKEGFWNLTLDLNENTVTAVFADNFPIPVETEGTVIWEGKTIFDSWSATATIDAAQFANAQVGQLVRAYFVNKTDAYNPVFKYMDWNDFTELQGGINKGDEYFEAVITEEALAILQADGLRFQGVGFTLVAVTLVTPTAAGETRIWEEETAFDSWTATIAIPAAKFATAEEGDVIRVFIKDKTGDYNPLFKHVGNWGDWTELQNTKTDGEGYFECTIAAEALDELKTDGLRFQGVGFTLVSVSLIKPVVTPTEYDIAPFTVYEDMNSGAVYIEYPYKPSWGENSGKIRILRGGTPAIESLGLTTSSKFVIYKEVGTTGQLQFNDANWDHDSLAVTCNDWNGDAATIEVPFNEAMLKCVTGETADGWGQTAFIIQGEGLTITKIVIVP